MPRSASFDVGDHHHRNHNDCPPNAAQNHLPFNLVKRRCVGFLSIFLDISSPNSSVSTFAPFSPSSSSDVSPYSCSRLYGSSPKAAGFEKGSQNRILCDSFNEESKMSYIQRRKGAEFHAGDDSSSAGDDSMETTRCSTLSEDVDFTNFHTSSLAVFSAAKENRRHSFLNVANLNDSNFSDVLNISDGNRTSSANTAAMAAKTIINLDNFDSDCPSLCSGCSSVSDCTQSSWIFPFHSFAHSELSSLLKMDGNQSSSSSRTYTSFPDSLMENVSARIPPIVATSISSMSRNLTPVRVLISRMLLLERLAISWPTPEQLDPHDPLVYVRSEHANMLFVSSCFLLFPSILALAWKCSDLAVVSLFVFVTSVNHWRSPRLDWRRRVDIFVVMCAVIYHSLAAIFRVCWWVRWIWFVGFFMVSLSYLIGRICCSRGNHSLGTYMHLAVHVFGALFNSLLYWGICFYGTGGGWSFDG